MTETTELAAKCRAEIEARLAVCEAATGGEWKKYGGHVIQNCVTTYYGICSFQHMDFMDNSEEDGQFIADSRNQRPGELRALLAALDELEAICPTGLPSGVLEVIARELGILEDK